MNDIRNFVIIAHIDHGKSTLADRLLEITGTVEARRMRPQYLDQLELERERGITIKMAPVRMQYSSRGNAYTLNLIDTPGHSDFSYEVSRALNAVEGAILLVDATKGIQAQTLSNLRAARRAGLTIVGAINKIDLLRSGTDSEGKTKGSPELEKLTKAVAELLEVQPSEILKISGKTGEGVKELLEAVIEKVPPPKISDPETKALIFDSLYDEHKGILAFVRVFGGRIAAADDLFLLGAHGRFKAKEVGGFLPQLRSIPELSAGGIGYVATGFKETDLVKIGDTVAKNASTSPLAGYREPAPVVFISFYPDGKTEFDDLKSSLAKLKLNDAALSFEPEANEALGRGLKVGFLGQLHFEITTSRLKNEFNLDFLTSFPSVAYRVKEGDREYVVKQAKDFPDKPDLVHQPMIKLEILTPSQYLNAVVSLKTTFGLEVSEIKNLGDNLLLIARMPLAELLRDFDDQLKSLTAGYASFSYELDGEEVAEAEKLEILLAGEAVPALTRVVPKKDLEREARATVERLKDLLPKEQFSLAIQARSQGKIIARETIAAMKKALGDFGKNSGDRTRKMKLWKKQKRGKARLKEAAKVNIPVEIFREILKK